MSATFIILTRSPILSKYFIAPKMSQAIKNDNKSI